jgi:hypothetical protein
MARIATRLERSDDNRLMREASIRSRKAGEKNISPNSVRKVTEVCLVGLRRFLWDNADSWGFGIAENVAEIQRLSLVNPFFLL